MSPQQTSPKKRRMWSPLPQSWGFLRCGISRGHSGSCSQSTPGSCWRALPSDFSARCWQSSGFWEETLKSLLSPKLIYHDNICTRLELLRINKSEQQQKINKKVARKIEHKREKVSKVFFPDVLSGLRELGVHLPANTHGLSVCLLVDLVLQILDLVPHGWYCHLPLSKENSLINKNIEKNFL